VDAVEAGARGTLLDRSGRQAQGGHLMEREDRVLHRREVRDRLVHRSLV
jgi:hypothetical protein